MHMKKLAVVPQLVQTEPVMAIFKATFPLDKFIDEQRFSVMADRQQLSAKLTGNVDLHPLSYLALRKDRMPAYMPRDFWIVN